MGEPAMMAWMDRIAVMEEEYPRLQAVAAAANAWRKARRTDHPGALYWRDTPDVREAELKLIAAVDALNVQERAQMPLDSTKPPHPPARHARTREGRAGC